MARIISISSGKGGVGKTTFAINFGLELSKYGKTILIDLDMGTSSVRNHLDFDIQQDLYHFLKKEVPLENCLHSLPEKLDHAKKYQNFHVIVSPKGFFEDIVNLNYAYKLKLITAINKLDADFIILDLRAGLDYRVLDFLPRANTGIVIFTPLVPAADYSATELVVALVVRRLRRLFSRSSPIYRNYSPKYFYLFNDLLGRIEDVYDNSLINFDDFLYQIKEAIGEGPVTHYVEGILHSFRAYYVLNQFNGLEQTIEKVVKPLSDSIKRRVSTFVQLINLGWIVYDELIMEASIKKIPALILKKDPIKIADKADDPFKRLEGIRRSYLTEAIKQPKPFEIKAKKAVQETKIDPLLNAQLEILQVMFDESRKEQDFRKNFDYITRHSLYIMKNYPYYAFGDRLLSLMVPEIDGGVRT